MMLVLLFLSCLVSMGLNDDTTGGMIPMLPELRTDDRGLPFCDNENLNSYICHTVERVIRINDRNYTKKFTEPKNCITPAIAKKC
uniref:Uncharacterized protein n=1 Tax=Romanomermis culicivorax TaxID=13658 RepID=A0A915JXR2_ROMCU